jgi:hypothetical protein
MPVIQLPRDTRWSELGTGISNALSQVAEAYVDKQATQGVAQIMDDPNIAETKKQTEVYKQFGQKGIDKYKEFVTAQVLQATIAQKKADALKDLAAAGQVQGRDDMTRMLMGLPPVSTPGTMPSTATPNAPVAGGATPTPSIASVLGGSSSTPAAPTSSPTSAIVGALGGGPTQPTLPAGADISFVGKPGPGAPGFPATAAPAPATTAAPPSPIDRMIDLRATAAGVTLSNEEKAALRLQVGAHLSTANGLSEAMAPVDKYLEVKQKGALQAPTLSKAQSEAEVAKASAANAAGEAAAKLRKTTAEATTAEAGAEAAPAVAAAAAATAPLNLPKYQAELQIAQQNAAQGKPSGMTAAQVQSAFPTFSPEQAQAVEAADKGGGAKAATAEIGKIVQANVSPAVGEGTAKFLRDAAAYGSITERFANEMAAAPEKLGAMSLSGVRARMEGLGLPIGDPQLLALLNSQKLAAATSARETGNWGVSGTNLQLSKQTSANIDKTAMSNVMMFAGAAAQKLQEADVEKANYEGNPRAQAAIDAAMQPWKNIQAITNTLNATVVKDSANPKAKERDVVYFMGNQVDPNTMRALVRQDNTEYTVKPQGEDKRTKYSGADIFAMARAAGVDPVLMLQRLGGKP